MKKIIPLITITILLIIISIFLFAQNQNLKNEIGVLNNKIADLEKQKSTPLVDKPPTGWKEYTDEQYRFKVWYPENFSYFSNNYKTNTRKEILDNRNEVYFYIELSDGFLPLLDIAVYSNNPFMKDIILKNAKEQGVSNDKIDEYITTIKINGIDFYKFNFTNQTRYYVKKNEIIFSFDADEQESTGNVFNQMVQSFQFID